MCHRDGPVRFDTTTQPGASVRATPAGRMEPRMTKKLPYLLVVAGLAVVAVISFALPATAEQRTFRVRLSDGSIISVTVDAACGSLPSLPGHVVSEVPGACSTPALPTQPSAPANPTTIISPPSGGSNGGSNNSNDSSSSGSSGGGSSGHHSSHGGKTTGGGSSSSGTSSSGNPQGTGQATGQGTGSSPTTKHPAANATPPTHSSNGVPTPSNPTFFSALPGP